MVQHGRIDSKRDGTIYCGYWFLWIVFEIKEKREIKKEEIF